MATTVHNTALYACAATAALVLTAACQREEISAHAGRLAIQASVETAARLPETKATIVGTTFPQSRMISASAWLRRQTGQTFFSDAPFAWDGSLWSSDKHWPANGTLDVYAVSADGLTLPLSALSASGATYTLGDNSALQADVLYAAAARQDDTQNAITMSFRHAFASLVFVARCTEGFDGSAGRGVELTGITVSGLRWSGTLSLAPDGTLTTDLGSGVSDASLPGLTSYEVPEQEMDHTAAATYFGIGSRGLLVPRQQKTAFTVQFNVHDGSGGVTAMTHTYTPDGSVWEDGCKYVYVLKFDGSQLLVEPQTPVPLALVLTAWNHNDDRALFPENNTNSTRPAVGIDGWDSGSGNEATVTFPGE